MYLTNFLIYLFIYLFIYYFIIKLERHIRKRGAKEEDTIIHYTKNLPPIVGFKHDEIPIPTWVYSENLNNNSNSSPTKRKRKGKEEENEEMVNIYIL